MGDTNVDYVSWPSLFSFYSFCNRNNRYIAFLYTTYKRNFYLIISRGLIIDRKKHFENFCLALLGNYIKLRNLPVYQVLFVLKFVDLRGSVVEHCSVLILVNKNTYVKAKDTLIVGSLGATVFRPHNSHYAFGQNTFQVFLWPQLFQMMGLYLFDQSCIFFQLISYVKVRLPSYPETGRSSPPPIIISITSWIFNSNTAFWLGEN